MIDIKFGSLDALIGPCQLSIEGSNDGVRVRIHGDGVTLAATIISALIRDPHLYGIIKTALATIDINRHNLPDEVKLRFDRINMAIQEAMPKVSGNTTSGELIPVTFSAN